MSILQDYEKIRKENGEEKYWHIQAFLEKHPNYLLSDVYYKEHVWDEFEDWEKENFKEVILMTKNELIDTMNSILKNHFDYVPLYKTISLVDELIKKGVVTVKEEPKEDLF